MSKDKTGSPANPFNRESAGDYIRDLFTFVLGRKQITTEELQYWTTYLIDRQDAAEVLRLFALSEENAVRLKAIAEATAGYPPGHFYSPIVNLKEVQEDQEQLFRQGAAVEVSLNIGEQKVTFGKLMPHFSKAPFSDEPGGAGRYYYNNTSYAYGDALIYWAMISEFKPKKIIEIGSGFTSALALDAIDFHQLNTTCIFIDPYPALLKQVAAPISSHHTLIEERVQKVDPSIVDALDQDDILFVDSSHVVKTGSDVQYELFKLLPRLKAGVIVHFHDIFYPFEYPKEWVLDERKSWNELYFVHSFLMYNKAFEIIYFNDCFAKCCVDTLAKLPLGVRSRLLVNPGGGLWLRRM